MNKTLQDFFKVMVFASGTPAAYQKAIGHKYSDNICACSPKTAIENEWIQKPVLNLVNGKFDLHFPQIITSVLHREIELCKNEVFKPTILVNFPGIDDIAQFVEFNGIKEQIGVNFHLVTIHSIKTYNNQNGYSEINCFVDNTKIKSSESYQIIESIDDEYFKDDLPIIVCQVDMIGEGINVKSFNSVITTSNSDKKVMQQVGRGMRNYFRNGKDKVHNGHCNLYMVYDNMSQVAQLINNLAEYELTDDCFDWGKRLDVRTGSGTVFEDAGHPNVLNSQDWEDIDIEHDLEILTVLTNWDKKRLKKMTKTEIGYWLKFEDKELDILVKNLKDEGWDKYYRNFNNKYAMLYDQVLNISKLQSSDSVMREVWKNNMFLFLKMMTKNDNFAKFLKDHIGDNLNYQLSKMAR